MKRAEIGEMMKGMNHVRRQVMQSGQEQMDDLVQSNRRNAELTELLGRRTLDLKNFEEERDCSRQEVHELSTSLTQKSIGTTILYTAIHCYTLLYTTLHYYTLLYTTKHNLYNT